jgi:hypothetical protein
MRPALGLCQLCQLLLLCTMAVMSTAAPAQQQTPAAGAAGSTPLQRAQDAAHLAAGRAPHPPAARQSPNPPAARPSPNSDEARQAPVSDEARHRLRQGLTLVHFSAQLEDLREHIAHVRAQLEHLRDTSTGSFGSYGGQSELKLSGKGQSKLKLSGNGNLCKPLATGASKKPRPLLSAPKSPIPTSTRTARRSSWTRYAQTTSATPTRWKEPSGGAVQVETHRSLEPVLSAGFHRFQRA